MTAADELTVLLMSGSWYENNAYMSLLSSALREHGVDVRTPTLLLTFPLTRAALHNRAADVMQLDWIYDYYATDDLSSPRLNDLVSYVRAVAFLMDLLIISFLDVRIVRSVHNKRSHEGIYPRTERVINECVFWVADAITVKCSAAADEIASAYHVPEANEMHVVPDGNYITAYENDVSRAESRADLEIDDSTFVYLFFGQIRPYKGIPELIESFMSLDIPDSELWIVGSPYTSELEAEIRRLVADKSRIETRLSFIPPDRVQYYLNAADVLVLPYRRILNSGSAHLGLSFATPIVAPAIGCLPETVPPENDFLYDPNEDAGLTRALRRTYESGDLDRVGSANYQRAHTQNWGRTCKLLIGVYARPET